MAADGSGRGPWDCGIVAALIDELGRLREAMIGLERRLAPRIREVDPAFAPSARNLAHYLALRRTDIRPLQERLAWLGVSSLGRAETHVLANLDKVLGILHRLLDRPWTARGEEEPVGFNRGRTLLEQHTVELLGPAPPGRAVRIMVTLPAEAADDFALVRKFVAAGMDVARINCAHDGPAAWTAMAAHVRRAAPAAGRPVKVLMDLAGPKLRTGPIEIGPAVLKLRPERDAYGRVIAPARLGLRAEPPASSQPQGGPELLAPAAWLARLRPADRIHCVDARGARRTFQVVQAGAGAAVLETEKTVYLTPQTDLRHLGGGRRGERIARLHGFATAPGRLRLHRGDVLYLTRSGVGHPARGTGRRRSPASVPCTLPEVFRQVRAGERIWFDDGRIGGVVRRATRERLEISITDARDGGEWLAEDKGINLPDSALELPALGEQDRRDLAVVAKHADLVGLSFAQRAADVDRLRDQLARLGAAHLGVILKIETRLGFENLPDLAFAAMRSRAAGIMIARGDLAVECGYERLAEVQEEILWLVEAAHLPVVWATQVLESLAKSGRPSRAEITDAAMGVRAECVMLNKGPHVLEAIRVLDDILRRMQAHQSKKRPLMRALRSFRTPGLVSPPSDRAATAGPEPATGRGVARERARRYSIPR